MRQVVEGQIAAIDNLAAHFKLQLIIPYITTLGEFRHWRDYVRTRLTHNIAVGAMAETPAALLDMNHWFDDADFVAIGTNDLMQCLFAADRDLPPLRHYLNPYAPFLFRLLHRAALDIGNRNHKVQVCGLMSQFPGILPLLLAMGYRAFSVEPTRIPYLAQTVTRTDVRATQHLVEQVYNASNAKAVCQLLDVPLPAIWSDE
jgi:phosphoenolpyruvate-protein kinase (PTS system EI component)